MKQEIKPLLEPDKARLCRRNCILELTSFLYFATLFASKAMETIMLLEKAKSVGHTMEASAETIVAGINSWKLMIQTGLSIVIALYSGLLFDKYAQYRKLLLYIPVMGQLCLDIGNCLNAYYWNWRAESAGILQSLLPGLTGSSICFVTLATTYLSSLSTKEERTTRIGFFYSIYAIGIGTGVGLSGFMAGYLGFIRSFFLCSALNLINLVIGLTSVETIPEQTGEHYHGNRTDGAIMECVRVIIRRRKGNGRVIIILCLLIYPLLAGLPLGEASVMYLYVRYRFRWSATDFSLYITYRMITILLGTTFCVEVLCRRMRLPDAVIGMVGCFSELLASVLQLIISLSWQIYAVALLNIFQMGLSAVVSSMATKHVESHEYGKLNALLGVTECVVPFMYPLYNQVYLMTVQFLPACIFIVSSVISFICFFLFTIMYIVDRETIGSRR